MSCSTTVDLARPPTIVDLAWPSTRVEVCVRSITDQLLLDSFTHAGLFAGWTGGLQRTAYDGPIIRIRRGSDNAPLDIDAVGGVTDLAAIATHCAGTTGYLVTLYDQSGNGKDITRSDHALQPIIYSTDPLGTIGEVTHVTGPVLGENGYLAAVFDADQGLSRADALGLTGDPALTIVGDYAGESEAYLCRLGPVEGPNMVGFFIYNDADDSLVVEVDIGANGGSGFLVMFQPGTGNSFFQMSKAANCGDLIPSTYPMRANGVLATVQQDGAPATAGLTDGGFEWAATVSGNAELQLRSHIMVFNAQLSVSEQTAIDAWEAAHHA